MNALFELFFKNVNIFFYLFFENMSILFERFFRNVKFFCVILSSFKEGFLWCLNDWFRELVVLGLQDVVAKNVWNIDLLGNQQTVTGVYTKRPIGKCVVLSFMKYQNLYFS
jgi:hypothetical protein